MLDVDTFLTALYVIADDFCQSRTPKKRPGPEASLSESEAVTLAIFARWGRFASERDFHRYAAGHLTGAFPDLPSRPRFNRLARSHTESIEMTALYLAQLTERGQHPYEALDCSATPVRDCKRRGSGWLAGCADIGWSNSVGWREGFNLPTSVAPCGTVTGFCYSAASTAEGRIAETFLAVRALPDERLASVGSLFGGVYVTDKGFEGIENHRQLQVTPHPRREAVGRLRETQSRPSILP